MANGAGDRQFLTNCKVWNTEQAKFVEDVVVVAGGEIVAVEPSGQVPEGELNGLRIDLGGGYLLPGLIDCHFHLISRTEFEITPALITEGAVEGVFSSRRVLEAGVTTVRDPGCKHHGIYTLRRLINEGKVRGPRAYVSGPNPTGSAAPQDWRNKFCDGVEGMRAAVREEWLAGADFIKIILSRTDPASGFTFAPRFVTDEEIAVAVSEAHLLGALTSSHCEGLPAARAAINAGMDCLEHALHLDEDLVAQMSEQGAAIVPTMWVFLTENELSWGDIKPHQAEQYRNTIEREHQLSFELAKAAGLTIGVGTDAIPVVPSQDVIVRELDALINAGMSTVEAIQAATLNGAKILDKTDCIGTIAPGRYADFVVVDDNPVEDIWALARPRLVMKDGTIELDLRGEDERAKAFWATFDEDPYPEEGIGRGHWMI